MNNIPVYDLSNCELSDRHGSYYGMAGDKDGILINGEYWIVKYPKPEREFQKSIGMSYSTSPLSEFIGSHIYEILGIPVHETILGIRNDKVVVACKDFCKHRGDLMEMKGIKNGANKELAEMLDQEMHYSSTGDRVNLNELLMHLDYNPIIQKCPDTVSRFWSMVVIDVLIDNTDRNNGNWGILYNEETKKYSLAPVYDNGNAFANKASDERIKQTLNLSETERKNLHMGSRTAFDYNGHILSAKKMLKLDNDELKAAINSLSPIIQSKLTEIEDFINAIPDIVDGKRICSESRKKYYIEGIVTRYENLIYPEYERNIESYEELEENENTTLESMDDFNLDDEDFEL